MRYQGQLYDAESGQYLSPDSIGLAGGIRSQAYVHNPMTRIDPLGLAESACEQRKGFSKI
ncbi:RHS repeat-associated core domain-containing protein [Pectobacterium polonicum]